MRAYGTYGEGAGPSDSDRRVAALMVARMRDRGESWEHIEQCLRIGDLYDPPPARRRLYRAIRDVIAAQRGDS